MRLQYGNYQHAAGENWYQISRWSQFSDTNDRIYDTERWTIFGVVLGTSQSDLQTKMAAIESAYSIDGQDITVYVSNGTGGEQVAHRIVSNETLSGVMVVNKPSWLPGHPQGAYGSGAENVRKRSYQIVIEATRAPSSDAIVMWNERLTVTSSGGPRIRCVESMTGLPQTQILASSTVWRCVQSGSALGLLNIPPLPQPIWPGNLLEAPFIQSVGTPTYWKNGFVLYPASWSYSFESPIPLFGLPTARPTV